MCKTSYELYEIKFISVLFFFVIFIGFLYSYFTMKYKIKECCFTLLFIILCLEVIIFNIILFIFVVYNFLYC